MTANRFNFKIWDKKNKVFIYDFHLLSEAEDGFMYFDRSNRDYVVEHNDNNDYIILQSTGLVDKKGKEVFEGDVIKFDGKYTKAKRLIRYSEKEGRLVACYTDFVYDYCDFNKDWISQWEVIGNIYENPELLTK